MKTLNVISQDSFTRVNSDMYGNPRFALHFLSIELPVSEGLDTNSQYNNTVALAKKLLPGSRKYNTKSFGGGIVVQSYNIHDEVKAVNCHNMAMFIQMLLDESDYTANKVINYRVLNNNMFEFTIEDNFVADPTITTVYITPNDGELTIKQALANKSLIRFSEVK